MQPPRAQGRCLVVGHEAVARRPPGLEVGKKIKNSQKSSNPPRVVGGATADPGPPGRPREARRAARSPDGRALIFKVRTERCPRRLLLGQEARDVPPEVARRSPPCPGAPGLPPSSPPVKFSPEPMSDFYHPECMEPAGVGWRESVQSNACTAGSGSRPGPRAPARHAV